jgi:hypothetical protein
VNEEAIPLGQSLEKRERGEAKERQEGDLRPAAREAGKVVVILFQPIKGKTCDRVARAVGDERADV